MKPRHARLAVYAASALAVFLFETHKNLAKPSVYMFMYGSPSSNWK